MPVAPTDARPPLADLTTPRPGRVYLRAVTQHQIPLDRETELERAHRRLFGTHISPSEVGPAGFAVGWRAAKRNGPLVFHVSDGRALHALPLTASSPRSACCLTPDGRTALVLDEACTVHEVDLATRYHRAAGSLRVHEDTPEALSRVESLVSLAEGGCAALVGHEVRLLGAAFGTRRYTIERALLVSSLEQGRGLLVDAQGATQVWLLGVGRDGSLCVLSSFDHAFQAGPIAEGRSYVRRGKQYYCVEQVDDAWRAAFGQEQPAFEWLAPL